MPYFNNQKCSKTKLRSRNNRMKSIVTKTHKNPIKIFVMYCV